MKTDTVEITLTFPQLEFLKHCLNKTDVKGSEVPLFVDLVETIKRGMATKQEVEEASTNR